MSGKHKVGVPAAGKHRHKDKQPSFAWVAKLIESTTLPKPKRKVPPPTEQELAEEARLVRMRLLEERHRERLSSYDYMGSQAHLEDLHCWLADRTHEDIRPPWEED